MLKFLAALLFVLLVGIAFCSGSESEDLESHCSEHCLSKMSTMMDFVAANQGRWKTCKETRANATRAERIQLGVQVEALRVALTDFQAYQESRKERKAKIEARVLDFLQFLGKKNSQLWKVKETVEKLNRRRVPPGFEIIGNRYFYIENTKELTWNASELACRQMGGYLASILLPRELGLISAQLKEDTNYWLGACDHGIKYDFRSVASGLPILFMYLSNPKSFDYEDNSVQCLSLTTGEMHIKSCSQHKFNFICQADERG